MRKYQMTQSLIFSSYVLKFFGVTINDNSILLFHKVNESEFD